jgi:hypothetical protein
MNLLVLFGDGAITWEKMTKTLHHALWAIIQFSVIFLGDTPSPNKNINSFFKTLYHAFINAYHRGKFVFHKYSTVYHTGHGNIKVANGKYIIPEFSQRRYDVKSVKMFLNIQMNSVIRNEKYFENIF